MPFLAFLCGFVRTSLEREMAFRFFMRRCYCERSAAIPILHISLDSAQGLSAPKVRKKIFYENVDFPCFLMPDYNTMQDREGLKKHS